METSTGNISWKNIRNNNGIFIVDSVDRSSARTCTAGAHDDRLSRIHEIDSVFPQQSQNTTYLLCLLILDWLMCINQGDVNQYKINKPQWFFIFCHRSIERVGDENYLFFCAEKQLVCGSSVRRLGSEVQRPAYGLLSRVFPSSGKPETAQERCVSQPRKRKGADGSSASSSSTWGLSFPGKPSKTLNPLHLSRGSYPSPW